MISSVSSSSDVSLPGVEMATRCRVGCVAPVSAGAAGFVGASGVQVSVQHLQDQEQGQACVSEQKPVWASGRCHAPPAQAFRLIHFPASPLLRGVAWVIDSGASQPMPAVCEPVVTTGGQLPSPNGH